jgi:polysaccharide export outer membrane protein
MRERTLVAIGICLLVGVGCQSSRRSTPNAEGPDGVFHHATDHQVSTREYRVDPPDEVIIKAPNIKELHEQRQRVRPDGKISLNLLDEVYVAGLTPSEINALLKKLVSKYYDNPDIKVEVVANSKFYYVFGFGVHQQGRYAYTGRDTVIGALAEAGFNNEAWPEQVLVSRPGKNGEHNATAVVDFTKIWGYGDLSQNYLLEEGDIIEVRLSKLAKFNRNLTQMISPITGASSAVVSSQVVASNGDVQGGARR